MATLVIHGTIPVKAPFTVRWWWDSWHESGFLHAMAEAMQNASHTSQDDVWKVNGQPVAKIAALDTNDPDPRSSDIPWHMSTQSMMGRLILFP